MTGCLAPEFPFSLCARESRGKFTCSDQIDVKSVIVYLPWLMFRVSLIDLDRSGPIEVHQVVGENDAIWAGADLHLSGPVQVALTVSATPTGQVVARGVVSAPMARECRRCLEAVEHLLREPLSLVWEVKDQLAEEDDGEIRPLDPTGNELNMGDAIREELILVAPTFVLCKEDCLGLCPQCGIDRNTSECECTHDEPDPRWEALRELRND